MNSSGIKRGLAATAVGALAVTGLPFLASSASAAPGDEFQFVAAGPTRDSVAANAIGGYVVLKSKEGTVSTSDAQDADFGIKAASTDLSGSANNANQTIDVNLAGIMVIPDGASNTFGGDDGFDEIYVPVRVDTATTGGTANYALYLNDASVDHDSDPLTDEVPVAGVQSTEPRAQVTQSTSGAPASISVDPASQVAASGAWSGDYVGTVKDSAGRTTQLLATGEALAINPDDDTAIDLATVPVDTAAGADGDTINVPATAVAQRGQFTFQASSSVVEPHSILIDGPGAVDATAMLDVVEAAGGITADEVDFVTGADTWDGFDGGAFGGASTQIRPDQTAVTVNVNSPDNAGLTLTLAANSTDVTFGGSGSSTKTVQLNAQGVGSATFNVDASSIAANDDFTITGGGINETFVYTAPAFTEDTIVVDGVNYLSAFGGTVTANVTVTDQYGVPAAGTYMSVQRTGGANADAAQSARKQLDANGKVSFTLTDTKATAASADPDTLVFRLFAGQFDATALATDNDSKITYTASGQGADFSVRADNVLPTGAAYDPNTVFALPLTDTQTSTTTPTPVSDPESIVLGITGGTAGAPVTVSVDNGALVLKNDETRLSQGSASDTGLMSTDTFKIVGTKTGLVNVTVASGGVTKTFQVSIHSGSEMTPPVDSDATSRNVTVTGPEKAEAGDVVTFTAKVTDAFGNPVFGTDASALVASVSGPGQLLGANGTQTNAAGELTFQVKILEQAENPVGLTVTGTGFQFGAAANRLTAGATTDNATGLTASANTATATIAEIVNIAQLEEDVEEAQAAVDAAQDKLDDARGDLQVAKAEQSVAQKAVKAAKKDLKQAKKQKKGVKAAKAQLRNAKGDLQVAKAAVKSEQGKVNRAKTALAEAQAELEAAEQALEDAQS